MSCIVGWSRSNTEREFAPPTKKKKKNFFWMAAEKPEPPGPASQRKSHSKILIYINQLHLHSFIHPIHPNEEEEISLLEKKESYILSIGYPWIYYSILTQLSLPSLPPSLSPTSNSIIWYSALSPWMDLLLKYDLPTLALVLALIAVIVRLLPSLFFSWFFAHPHPPPPPPPLDCSQLLFLVRLIIKCA